MQVTTLYPDHNVFWIAIGHKLICDDVFFFCSSVCLFCCFVKNNNNWESSMTFELPSPPVEERVDFKLLKPLPCRVYDA